MQYPKAILQAKKKHEDNMFATFINAESPLNRALKDAEGIVYCRRCHSLMWRSHAVCAVVRCTFAF